MDNFSPITSRAIEEPSLEGSKTMAYLDFYLCMYVLQSIVHSVITLFLVEMSLKIWKIRNARDRFRYRLQVLVMPLLMFPLFQLVNPDRGSVYFIEDSAIFSSGRWLRIELWGQPPLLFLFLFVLLATSILTHVQEISVIFRNLWDKKAEGRTLRPSEAEIDLMVSELSRTLKIEKPSIWIVDDENPLLFIDGTTRNQDIIISKSLLTRYDKRELKSALAHELAHIVRRSNATTLLVFLARILMFYNPVSLLVFRRLIQDDEQVCDDLTVSITKDPRALASALAAFSSKLPAKGTLNFSTLRDVIESSTHNLLLQERISRLENQDALESSEFGWGGFALTSTSVLIITYFVV